ncbi:Na+/H+ antiporter NhaA [Novosphingobium lindaniclasticum]|uniref:Na+/H+ antiporter NhaA n=1 Tax=Novosphingobium lindaniclasticum TaxID=1329895 RepID=UPI00041E38D4|nr:Na+/H+ antiporter NhaA [Novosphingobium lindaniclasticum]
MKLLLKRPRSALRDFLRSEASGGILLMAAAALALVVANGPLAESYFSALHVMIGPMSLAHWINDGLMSLFFLLVGLEIKREFIDGHLSTWSDRALPALAAAAGMSCPAAIYLAIAGSTPGLARGWAIPAATDIAFAIGVMALLGKRVPASLKLFLTTVAIVDDMGAVAVIALAYTSQIKGAALLAAGVIMGVMFVLNRIGVKRLWPYLLLAALLWLAVLLSGVHATIAGVLAASLIPIRATPGAPDSAESPLHRLEHGLHGWVAYLVVPLFGFANAGVSLAGLGVEHVLAPLPLAVAGGLFLGKQLGVFLTLRLCAFFGLAKRPSGATWVQTYGMCLLCGIGFTMSLFVGALAFSDPVLVDEVKIGVLGGSMVSALAGFAVLRLAASPSRRARPRE